MIGVKTMSKNYIDPFSKATTDLALRFDAATTSKDYETLSALIDEAFELIKTETSASQARLYYSLATTYSDFAKFKGLSKDESFKKQLYYFRKSITLINAKEYDKEEYKPFIRSFKAVLFTNYANALDNCGRKIAAIEQYKNALYSLPQFGMALGNLGRVYTDYGILEYDPGHSDYFHFHAYTLMDEATTSSDPNTHDDAKKCFEQVLQCYDEDYIDKLYEVLLEIPDYTYDDPEEYAYRKWSLDNVLFLNTLNDLPGKDDNSCMYDSQGNLICFDSSEVLGEDIGFFIDEEQLCKYLDEKELSLIWTSLSEKRVIGAERNTTPLPDKAIHYSAVYRLVNGNVEQVCGKQFVDKLYIR